MPSRSNYICVACEFEMRPEKNAIFVEEHSGFDGRYKIWHADLWKCPNCGFELIAGFGKDALAEHFETEKYEILLTRVTHHIRETLTN